MATTTLTAGRKRIMRELDVGMFIPNAYISALAAGSFTSPNFFLDPVMAPDFLQVRNAGIVRGGAATSADFWRPAGTITISSGAVANVGSVWADTTLGSEDIELWYHRVRPDQEVLDSLNRVLSKEFVTTFLALSHLSGGGDGDMALSTDSLWTNVGSPGTTDKVTTTLFTAYGPRSYRVINANANEGTRSTNYLVRPTGTISAYAIASASIGTASFQPYDATNAAVFSAVSAVTSSERTPQLLVHRSVAVPTGCKSVQLNMLNTSATGDTYWNQVWLYNHDDSMMRLPALVAEAFHAPKIVQGIPRTNTGTGAYSARDMEFRTLTEGQDYWLVINQADGEPYKIKFNDTSYYDWPLFVEARIPQASLVTMALEADAFWDLNKVIPRWKKDLLETVYNAGSRRHPDWERQYNLASLQLTEAGKARQKESIAPARPYWSPTLNA